MCRESVRGCAAFFCYFKLCEELVYLLVKVWTQTAAHGAIIEVLEWSQVLSHYKGFQKKGLHTGIRMTSTIFTTVCLFVQPTFKMHTDLNALSGPELGQQILSLINQREFKKKTKKKHSKNPMVRGKSSISVYFFVLFNFAFGRNVFFLYELFYIWKLLCTCTRNVTFLQY